MPDRAESANWGNKPRYGEFEIVGADENKPRLLGEGSFGKTYEAVRTDSVAGGVIKESVAIKVLNPSILASESRRFQFIQELVALTKFKHSNLIHYIRCGEDDGEVYYAMELCRGGDLSRLVRRYRVLPEKVAALIGLQVAAGLRDVHQRHRLVHRDIKPSNIMLVDELESGLGVQQLARRLEEQEGLCRIVDFGLVNFALNLQEAQQRFVGSPMYASPEQISEQAVDGRSDIYSLGMTLWYLVQGKGPLLDDKGNDLKGIREAMRRHTIEEEHEPGLPPHLSPEFRAILAKMVAKKPEARYVSAAELQTALREFLRNVEEDEETKFTVVRLVEPIESVFEIETNLPARAGLRCHVARHKTTGDRVKLSVAAEVGEGPETELLAQQLCAIAELSRQPARLDTLLRVREVVQGADLLVFTEDLPPHLTLTEALAARKKAAQPVAFSEAVSLLRPIADALDFLIEHGQQTVHLRADELWLTRTDAADTSAPEPLAPWTELQAHFSMMCLPEQGGDVSLISSVQETISSSLHISELNQHPVPAFARLIFFIMNGTEVPAATQFTPTAYVPSARLGEAANALIRDLLCRKNAWTHATAVLKDLCAQEGVPWPASSLAISAQRTSTGIGTAGSPTGTASAPGTGAGASGSSLQGSRRGPDAAEKVCEVIGPGVVCSPYDPERRPQDVPAHQWVPSGRLSCQITQKIFRLPRKLDSLLARIVSPGVIQSPYAGPEVTQAVPWDEWIAGGEIVCAESGRRLALPQGLPAPEGILAAQRVGVIISPYDRVTVIPIPPERWEPGARVLCPVTQSSFTLPRVLPPLEAMADAGRPGVIATPFAPTMTWALDPAQWTAGREVVCPLSGKPLRLPAMVERWPAEGRVLDLARRQIGNPFRPDAPVEVPPLSWRAGAAVLCPQTGRTILLPANLPLLVGEAVEDRPGVIRSPYNGEAVPVAPKDWFPGVAITCPRTQLNFLMPGRLPEWIPAGSIAGLAPGRVRSPYAPDGEMQVKPEDWVPNQTLKCPESGRLFRLPGELPSLEAKLKPGRPGKVISPFTGEVQDVSVDDWKPGQRLECDKTSRTFRLPAIVEDWTVDGEWVPGSPGRIRSPYHPHPEFDLTPEQWRPKQVLTCPATQRKFRAPIIEPFPTLQLEKDAVQYALAEPEATESAAADALQRQHRTATPEQVQAIWARHDLETLEKRRRLVQVAEALPAEPGSVRSPYGSRGKAEVPAALWIEPAASMLCPETGRRFLLPAKRPALFARLAPGEIGLLISPYRPEEPFRISPEQWQPGRMVRCEHTGHPLQLPGKLPEWLPEGKLAADQPGIAFSPYGRHGAVRVPGANWAGGARVTCLETGRVFALPEKVPPLTATPVEDQPGRVMSPYARDLKLRIPHRQWKPGTRMKCPATKRTFVLPDTLPPWELKPFPWKPLKTAALWVVLAAGAWLVWSQRSRWMPAIPLPKPPVVAVAEPTPRGPDAARGETPPVTPPPAGPKAQRVVFTGGLDIEDWPKKKELPKGLRILHRGREAAWKIESGQLIATLEPAADDAAPASEVELQLPGWKPLKVALAAPAANRPFRTQSSSILPGSGDLASSAEGQLAVKTRQRLERQRTALPASIIPEGGTDYEILEANWVSRLSTEPEAAPPSVNPVKLRIVKGEIERPLPTGIYDFTLRGGTADKVTILPAIWKAGVPMSLTPPTFNPLPASLAGEHVGLMFTTPDNTLGIFIHLAVTRMPASVKAMVNPMPIKGGELVNARAIEAKKDELGVIENVRLTDPVTLEFDAPLRMFHYHWTVKEENGTRFMYGKLVEMKGAHLESEIAQLAYTFGEKARAAGVVGSSLAAERLKQMPAEEYRQHYASELKDTKKNAKYLMDTYSKDIKVKGCSIYFGLHSTKDAVRVAPPGKNKDWDLEKVPR